MFTLERQTRGGMASVGMLVVAPDVPAITSDDSIAVRPQRRVAEALGRLVWAFGCRSPLLAVRAIWQHSANRELTSSSAARRRKFTMNGAETLDWPRICSRQCSDRSSVILLQPSKDIGGFSDAMVVLFNTASLAADLCARFLPRARRSLAAPPRALSELRPRDALRLDVSLESSSRRASEMFGGRLPREEAG